MRFRALGAALVLVLFALWPVRAVAGPMLLFDVSNERVLYSVDADRPWYPASLTKIMTAYLAFEAIKQGKLSLDGKLVSSEVSAKMPASKIGIKVGGQISVELGLKSLIVKSANDVAVMIAEAVSGSHDAFIVRMNATARRLGMTATHFANPNGLPDPAQRTTARDLARLTVAVLRDFPEHAHFWAMPRMRIGRRRLRSHNSLLRTFKGANGIKTGFICDSGFNIVASAERDGRQLIAVVLGAPSPRDRGIRAKNLLDYGFNTYGWQLFFNSNTLDTLPKDAAGLNLASVRETVTAWSCGGRAARRARRRARLKRLARKKANASRQAAPKQKTGSPKKASDAVDGPKAPQGR